MFKQIILVAGILLSGAAFADNCDKPRDDFDGLYCLNKVYQAADNELNEVYRELRSFLTPEQKSKLKTTQIGWIRERNSRCSFRKDGNFFVSLGCTRDMTVERANQIRDRIRECKATGCQPGKL